MKTVSALILFLFVLGLTKQTSAQGVAPAGSTAEARLGIHSALSVRQAELEGTDTDTNSFFGWSIAASGNTVVVGAPGDVGDMGNSEPGMAYVFVKPADGWTSMVQTAQLSPSDNGYTSFGLAVAIAGDTVFVSGSDKVYVFVEPPGGWQNMTETAILQDQPSDSGDAFGESVAVNAAGDTVAIGAIYANTAAELGGAGYVFRKPPGGWQSTTTPDAVLTASDAQAYDNLGNSMAFSGNTIVAGDLSKPLGFFYGAAYVFVEPTSGWTNMTETAKLTASKQTLRAGLGVSVAISGDTIVAGATGAAQDYGAAYVFVEPAGGWTNSTETAEIGGPQYYDAFGASVSLTGKMLAVGASLATVGTAPEEGAVYLFLKPAAGWKSTTRFAYEFTAEYGVQDDGLGLSAVINGDTVIAGAPDAYNLDDVGLAYVFTMN